MRKPRALFLGLSIFLLLSLAILTGCRDEPVPEPEGTPIAVEVTETATSPTNAITMTPTAEPEPSPTFDPAVLEALPDWEPQLIYSSPAVGEESILDGAITLRFDQPMNADSVAEAFAIQPNVAGELSWPRPDTVIFTPSEQMERAQVYDVFVSDTAVSASGVALREPIDLQLQTVGFLEVSHITPADGTELRRDDAITVLFNRPVVPLVATQDQDQLLQPLVIEPAIDGRGEWVSTSIYRFTPTDGWAGGTNYSVTVPGGMEDVSGGVLAETTRVNFFTESPYVQSSYPWRGSDGLLLDESFSLSFNMAMDRVSTEAAISLSPEIPLEFAWENDDQTILITPTERLAIGTPYILMIDTSARARGSNATLEREEVIDFATVPLPAVIYTDPENLDQNAYSRGGVYFEFASPMDWETIVDQVEIIPEPDEVIYDYYEGGTWLSLGFKQDYSTEYTVVIPATAADIYGNILGEEYTLFFRTAEADPYVQFNLPYQVNHFSHSFATAVEFLHRNVSELEVVLYDAGLPVELAQGYYYGAPEGAAEVGRWTLPTDVVSQNDNSTTSLLLNSNEPLPNGVYYLTVTTPELRAEGYEPAETYLVVGDTNVVIKEMVDGVHVWATDIATGQPMTATVLALYDGYRQQLGTAETDDNGFASFDYTPPNGYFEGVTVIAEAAGSAGFGFATSQWNETVRAYDFDVPAGLSTEAAQTAYVYTDRPLYRPGDTVYFRGILRDQNYGRYNVPQTRNVQLVAESWSYSSAEPFSEQFDLELSPEGAFSGEFELPEGTQLGDYRLYLVEPYELEQNGVNFQVLEFRKPEFEASVTAAQSDLLRGEATTATVQADYFFGGVASDLPVVYTIYEQSYGFSAPAPYPWYSFGRGQEYFWLDFGGYYDGYNGNWVLDGEGTTDGDGRFVIDLPADLLADIEEDGSRQVTVEATVRDVSGQSVSSRAVVTFHAGEIYAGIQPANYVSQAGEETTFDVVTLDWFNDAVPETDVAITVYQRSWERNDDGYYDVVETDVGQITATTDELGEGSASLVIESGGSYRAEAAVTDSKQNTQISDTYFWVSGSDALWRPEPENRQLRLIPNKTEYRVAETAEILVQLPFASDGETTEAWVTIERGGLLEQQLVTLRGASDIVFVPIKEEHAPNAFVTIAVVSPEDESGEAESPYAEMRLGVLELPVDRSPLLLNLTIEPQLPEEGFYGAGDTAVFEITLKDHSGAPVEGEVSLALVDKALLSLAPDNAPNIADLFYGQQLYRSQIGASLLVSADKIEVELDTAEDDFDEAVVTEQAAFAAESVEEEEMMEADFAADAGGEVARAQAAPAVQGTQTPDGGAAVRADFRDTAYWEAQVVTDNVGRATVEIPLPDNLTTWQLQVKALATGTLVGQDTAEISVNRPLLIRPVTPRFFTVGDVVQLGAVVNNNTDTEQEVTVSLEAAGVTLLAPEAIEQVVTVPANGSTIVRWPVAVDDLDVRLVDLTFRVGNDEYADASKPTFATGPDQTIRVYRYNAEDIVATSGVLTADELRRVEAILLPEGVDTDDGELRWRLNASLAATIFDTFEALDNQVYDRSCAHGVASRLLPNVTTARAIELLALDDDTLKQTLNQLIPADVSDLEKLQKQDGGWGWCSAPESSPWFSAYVLLALDKAVEAGYEVAPEVIDRASGYLALQIEPQDRLDSNGWAANRQAFLLYVLSEVGQDQNKAITALFEENRDQLDSYAKALLVQALAINEENGDNGEEVTLENLLSDLSSEAQVSATGAHWEDSDYSNLSSDIRATAMVLSAYAATDVDAPFGSQAVNWLMNARDARIWRSTHDTVWVVLGLTDWLAATGELDADYSYEVLLNDTAVTDGAFNAENLAETAEFAVPIGDLKTDDVNFVALNKSKDGDGRLYYNAYLDTFISADLVDAVDRGIIVERTYYDAACDPEKDPCEPIASIETGQQVRVELNIVATRNLVYAIVEDYFPAGAEAIDPNLQTSATGFGGDIALQDGYRYGYWGWWYFNNIQYRDERITFTSNYLPEGTYQYTYYLDATIPGEYQVRPTFAREEFTPEVNGRGEGAVFVIEE